MYRIELITNMPRQKKTVVLPDGVSFSMSLYYIEQQKGWFIDELISGDFVLRGIRISNSPNFLQKYKNLIQFGLCCVTDGGREPMFIQDFAEGKAKLFALDSHDVQEFEEFLSAP